MIWRFPEQSDDDGRFRVLSVGRLSSEKNYACLVQAFAALADHFPSWDLVILGEGDQRPALERIVRREGLTGRVWLPGIQAGVSDWYEGAHFVLPALPTRGISECPNGSTGAWSPRPSAFWGARVSTKLIHDGTTGLLAHGNGDARSLAEALATLMSHPEKRKAMGVSARMAMEAYRPEAVMDAWERLLEGAIEGCED